MNLRKQERRRMVSFLLSKGKRKLKQVAAITSRDSFGQSSLLRYSQKYFYRVKRWGYEIYDVA